MKRLQWGDDPDDFVDVDVDETKELTADEYRRKLEEETQLDIENRIHDIIRAINEPNFAKVKWKFELLQFNYPRIKTTELNSIVLNGVKILLNIHSSDYDIKRSIKDLLYHKCTPDNLIIELLEKLPYIYLDTILHSHGNMDYRLVYCSIVRCRVKIVDYLFNRCQDNVKSHFNDAIDHIVSNESFDLLDTIIKYGFNINDDISFIGTKDTIFTKAVKNSKYKFAIELVNKYGADIKIKRLNSYYKQNELTTSRLITQFDIENNKDAKYLYDLLVSVGN